MHNLSTDDHTARLKNQRRSLLSLVARSRDPAAGLAWLEDGGAPLSASASNVGGVVHRTARLAAVTLLVAALAACSRDASPASPEEPETLASTSTDPTPTEIAEPESAVPPYLPAGDLPNPLRLEDIGARTVEAEPFADFAVAAGSGVWVSGVTPGAVRYDGASGAITARTRVSGEVGQALAATPSEVLVPVTNPAVLLRLDATTGEVRARVKLPADPLSEATTGVDGDTGYVLIDPLEPRIVVVEGDRIVDEIPTPEGAAAVRAGFGSLWVPTTNDTVERYSLRSGKWTTIAVGPQPRFLDVGFAAVWVMNQGDGSVTRIDARSRTTETLPSLARASAVATSRSAQARCGCARTLRWPGSTPAPAPSPTSSTCPRAVPVRPRPKTSW